MLVAAPAQLKEERFVIDDGHAEGCGLRRQTQDGPLVGKLFAHGGSDDFGDFRQVDEARGERGFGTSPASAMSWSVPFGFFVRSARHTLKGGKRFRSGDQRRGRGR